MVKTENHHHWTNIFIIININRLNYSSHYSSNLQKNVHEVIKAPKTSSLIYNYKSFSLEINIQFIFSLILFISSSTRSIISLHSVFIILSLILILSFSISIRSFESLTILCAFHIFY
ncbi:hypothetical protein DICPUDRAFT_81933 [Dictyostelium purpureum]|uniref:Uncharacterized protein n=1 Tax=Dictyostelium purpureum TaxID=5786 RepID=F0ZV11_DICPU|nr:uncharacterized protein DICPUDRAFT_81933 [Dictyostelium purpureum]EGC32213.1 hypothetical protein DICPUDRAFT_81933 [Dictyostelium purpureum]|eukprot:XP_003291249.1 hypothetical protein DICPUDRAFT_81933 [Dictyostelium purpureum]